MEDEPTRPNAAEVVFITSLLAIQDVLDRLTQSTTQGSLDTPIKIRNLRMGILLLQTTVGEADDLLRRILKDLETR